MAAVFAMIIEQVNKRRHVRKKELIEIRHSRAEYVLQRIARDRQSDIKYDLPI